MAALDENKVIERYLSGDNVRAVAKELNTTPQTIYNIIKRRNIQKRTSSKDDKARRLIEVCGNGAIVSEAAKQINISERTATRILRAHRMKGETLIVKRGRPKLSRSRFYDIENVDPNLIEIYSALRQGNFPYPQISKEDIIDQFARLKSLIGRLDNDEIRPKSIIGVKACAPFFPNRYDARSGNKMSAFDAWHDTNLLQRAIRFQIKHGDPTTPPRVLRAISMICRTPSIFRPAVAKFIYERYCPPGGSVWDPCSGYGGRLLGAAAAGVRYLGTDVDSLTVEGNRRLAETVGVDADVRLTPAETFDPPKVDLVFTSPPYFNREKYSLDDAQSWRKYGKTLDAWVTGFLRPVIERAWTSLSKGNYLILNIADLKEGSKVIPLVERTIESACAVGFLHAETLRMPLGAIKRKAPTEPVLVFRKL
jgi:transposase